MVSYEKYLDIPYNYLNDSLVISSIEFAQQYGINCVGLVHLFYKEELNVILPKQMRAIEIYHQNPYFTEISDQSREIGDIVFMGRKNIDNILATYSPLFNVNGDLIGKCPFHLGISLGEDAMGNCRILHANIIDKKVTVWTEKRVSTYIRYTKIFLRKRLLNIQYQKIL